MEDDRITPTPEQLKARRSRNVALAIALAIFVVVVYFASMAKLGPAVFQRPL
jgi:hypothetical protein